MIFYVKRELSRKLVNENKFIINLLLRDWCDISNVVTSVIYFPLIFSETVTINADRSLMPTSVATL